MLPNFHVLSIPDKIIYPKWVVLFMFTESRSHDQLLQMAYYNSLSGQLKNVTILV